MANHKVTLHDKLNDLIETARGEAEEIKRKIEDSSSLTDGEARSLITRARAIIDTLEEYMKINSRPPNG